MSEKIVQLHDKDGNNIYPVTNFTAISGGNETLANVFVEKSGDTMTGKLFTSATTHGSFGASTDSGALRIDGGTNYDKGAFLTLYGKDASGAGAFQLVAGDGTNRKEIRGQADGSLTWDGNPIYHTGNKPKFSEIAFLGTNPITSTTNDTTTNWATLGSGYAWYNTTNQLTNQPSQWGFVVSYSQGADIFQIWNSQSGGLTYFRSGNGAGWNGGWRKIYDTSNKPTPADIGALSLSGGTMTGVLIAQNNSNLTTKQVRNITISTSDPTASTGNVGDIWIVYEA